MRLVFAGTPEFGAVVLRALVRRGHDLLLVLTQPDARSGRGLRQHMSPVKLVAQELGIAVQQPDSLRSDEVAAGLTRIPAEAWVVAAYGLLLPSCILEAPRYGCVNVHASLLPRWRGAAPIQRAIMAGDTETGVCIMRMEVGLDTGRSTFVGTQRSAPTRRPVACTTDSRNSVRTPFATRSSLSREADFPPRRPRKA